MVDVWRSFRSRQDSDGNSSDRSMEVAGDISEDDKMGDTAWTNNESLSTMSGMLMSLRVQVGK